MDYSKVWQTLLVDFEIAVAKIAGGGDGASNIKGRVTYLAGVIGLDPLTMTFLGGSASAVERLAHRPVSGANGHQSGHHASETAPPRGPAASVSA